MFVRSSLLLTASAITVQLSNYNSQTTSIPLSEIVAECANGVDTFGKLKQLRCTARRKER
jgi:hypothetical protein